MPPPVTTEERPTRNPGHDQKYIREIDMTPFAPNRRTALSLTALGAAVALSACDSSGTSNPDPDPNPFTYQTTVEASNQIAGLNNSFQAQTETTGAQLPTSGSANYQGMFYMNDLSANTTNINDPVFYYGQMEVNASFAGSGSVTGTADNFIDGNNNFVDGQLNMTSGPITRFNSSTSFDATLSGEIDPVAGGTQTFNNLDLQGGFAGSSAQYVGGAGSDTLFYDDGSTVPFTYGFVAEQ